MRGADGRCGKAIPDRVVPERGQVPENLSPDGSVVESKDVRYVLHEDVAGSKLANGSGHLSPQNGLGVIKPGALACGRGALAGEAASDDVDSGNSVSSDGSDIIDDGSAGPAPLEDRPSPGIDLAQPCVAQAGEVQAVGEQPDPVEEAANGQHQALSEGMLDLPLSIVGPPRRHGLPLADLAPLHPCHLRPSVEGFAAGGLHNPEKPS